MFVAVRDVTLRHAGIDCLRAPQQAGVDVVDLLLDRELNSIRFEDPSGRPYRLSDASERERFRGDLERAGEGWPTFWCVDPLDGTKEFVKGLGEYTVNIALVEDGAAVLGVIYVPAKDVLYYAATGQGAWKVEGEGRPAPIRASDCQVPRSAVVSRSHLSKETEDFLAELGITDTVSHGSSIKICAVAEGKADIYPRHGPTCLWDTAAGSAIAIEAGCRVIDLEGEPLSYNPADGLKRPGFIVYPRTVKLTVGPSS